MDSPHAPALAKLADLHVEATMATLLPPEHEPVARTPWCVLVDDSGKRAAVRDADGNTLFMTTPGIAHLTVNCRNGHPEMLMKVDAMTELLRDIYPELRAHNQACKSEAVKQIVRKIDRELFPVPEDIG